LTWALRNLPGILRKKFQYEVKFSDPPKTAGVGELRVGATPGALRVDVIAPPKTIPLTAPE